MSNTFLPGADYAFDETDQQSGIIQFLTSRRTVKIWLRLVVGLVMAISVLCFRDEIRKAPRVRAKRRNEWSMEFDGEPTHRISLEDLEAGAEPHRIRIRQRDSIRLMVLKKCREFARQSGLEAEVSLN